jgi:tRNA-specific 2-thiouridylase
MTDGTIVGKHKGYPFYTVGQRKGLEIALGRPLFVVEIKPETNTVILGDLEDLERTEMWVRNINLHKYASIPEPMDAFTKIRYKDVGHLSSIEQDGTRMKVSFYDKVNAIAPGQAAVFYEGNDVIGGGWIEKSIL